MKHNNLYINIGLAIAAITVANVNKLSAEYVEWNTRTNNNQIVSLDGDYSITFNSLSSGAGVLGNHNDVSYFADTSAFTPAQAVSDSVIYGGPESDIGSIGTMTFTFPTTTTALVHFLSVDLYTVKFDTAGGVSATVLSDNNQLVTSTSGSVVKFADNGVLIDNAWGRNASAHFTVQFDSATPFNSLPFTFELNPTWQADAGVSYEAAAVTMTAIPEPTSLALLGLGFVAFALRRRMK